MAAFTLTLPRSAGPWSIHASWTEDHTGCCSYRTCHGIVDVCDTLVPVVVMECEHLD